MAKKNSLKRIFKFLGVGLGSAAVLGVPIVATSCSSTVDIKDKDTDTKETEKETTDKSSSTQDVNPNNPVVKHEDHPSDKTNTPAKKESTDKTPLNPDVKLPDHPVVIPVAANSIKSSNIPGKPSIAKPALTLNDKIFLVSQDLAHTPYDNQSYRNDRDLLKSDASRAEFIVKNKDQYPSEVTKDQILWSNQNIQLDSQHPRDYKYAISDQIEYDNDLGYIGFYYRIYMKSHDVEFTTPWMFTKIFHFKSTTSSHYIKDLEGLKKLTSRKIFESAPLTQKLQTNFQNFLVNYQNDSMSTKGIDFINYIPNSDDGQMLRDFSSEVSSLGYYGDFGQTGLEKIQYSPDNIMNDRAMLEQQYLPHFTNTKNTVEINVQNTQLTKLIKDNPFGFLPSNLSQLLYYSSYSLIEEVLKIHNIKNIWMNFNDDLGTAELLVETTNGSLYLANLNSENTEHSLKKVNDFYQYQYDRSFFFDIKMFKPVESNRPKEFSIQPSSTGGTGWIFDRVLNQKLEAENKLQPDKLKRKYQFLAATNLHVLDLSPIYDKYYSNSIYGASDSYNAFWNSGLRDRNNTNRNLVENRLNFNVQKRRTMTAISILDPNNPYLHKAKTRAPIYLSKPKAQKISDIDKNASVTFSDINYHVDSSINSDNYLDAIWYTPRFRSENIRSYVGNEYEQIFTQKNYQNNQIGSVDNGGADIAFTKIEITGAAVKELFPTLYDKLDTPQESQWYTGLGTNQVVNSNDTLFLAGFPSTTWDNIHTSAGILRVKNRQVTLNDVQSAWMKYNEQENTFYNKTINDVRYQKYQIDWTNPEYIKKAINKVQLSSNATVQQQADFKKFQDHLSDYTPMNQKRGMSIPSVLENATLAVRKGEFSETALKNHRDNYLQGGASGSLVINSRFEPVGLVYKLIYGNLEITDNDNIYELGNAVTLLTSPQVSDNGQWNGSIKDDVVKKLQQENNYTLVLNPESKA
ncbi:DUF31 family putative serine protease [Ureaplasma ceti]|uniref:DUF31 domain-containing protein n=1 Tax=Ureaplasma ceti TaxID=3119530 RepID=A0ABP9U4R9_9BACT